MRQDKRKAGANCPCLFCLVYVIIEFRDRICVVNCVIYKLTMEDTYMYTCEIRITLTDKREYLCVFSDGDAVCPIDVRRAKSAFKKQLAEVKTVYS